MSERQRTKRLFRSYVAAEEAYRVAERNLQQAEEFRAANYAAVKALLRDEVRWLPPEGPYRAGLIDPDGAMGGYAIVLWDADDSIGTHIDVWLVERFASCYGPGSPYLRTDDAERMALYRLALALKEARDKACDEARDRAPEYKRVIVSDPPPLFKESIA